MINIFFNTGNTFSEKIKIVITKVLQKVILSLSDNGLLTNYINEIKQFKEFGYQLERLEQSVLKISKNGYECYVRPYTSDLKVFEQIYINREYEYLLDIIEKKKNSETLNIIDAGSNIGLFAQWLKQYVKINKIISIEADKENHQFQSRYNIAVNKSLINKAIWGTDNQVLTLGSTFRDGEHWAKSIVHGDKEIGSQVSSITLNELYRQYFDNVDIDILKIDVEGAEANIFTEPSSYNIILTKTNILAIEIHDEFNCRETIYDVLKQYNFKIIEKGETTFAYKIQ